MATRRPSGVNVQVGLDTWRRRAGSTFGADDQRVEAASGPREEISLADEVGLNVFGLGEHHHPDYAVLAPAVALAAAPRTRRIRLTSAVSVLSSDDPIRVFQQFATLYNLTEGRAEIMGGRGSFIESFPLFGYDLDDYGRLFAEKLALLIKLNEREHVTWPAEHHTPAIENGGVCSAAVPGPPAHLDLIPPSVRLDP